VESIRRELGDKQEVQCARDLSMRLPLGWPSYVPLKLVFLSREVVGFWAKDYVSKASRLWLHIYFSDLCTNIPWAGTFCMSYTYLMVQDLGLDKIPQEVLTCEKGQYSARIVLFPGNKWPPPSTEHWYVDNSPALCGNWSIAQGLRPCIKLRAESTKHSGRKYKDEQE
jgi:hypothetical protein